MFYFIVAVGLVLFATLLETLVLAGNDWKTTKFTPVYKFMVNTAGINGFCEAFWQVVIVYTAFTVMFILAGSYLYGWYHIFTGVTSKFTGLTIVISSVLFAVFMLYLATVTIRVINKRFSNKSKDEPKPLKIVVSIKNLHSKFKDKYCPTLK